jgi:hypothetical protein
MCKTYNTVIKILKLEQWRMISYRRKSTGDEENVSEKLPMLSS